MPRRAPAPSARPAPAPFFVDAVLECVASIPTGRVLSYGDVAELIGSHAPRAVGRVLAAAGSGVPWHRVVRANGSFAPQISAEQGRRLLAEGVPMSRSGVDMSDHAGIRWNPSDNETLRRSN